MEKSDHLSDSELLILLKKDSQHAYTEIYNRYERLLYIHAYKKLRDREEARDIVQELLTSLWTNRHTLTVRSNLAAYLYTSIRNRIFDLIAHQKTESKYLDSLQAYIDKGHQNADHQTRHNQLQAIIEKEIAALPPKMRAIFELSRKGHHSHRQIAEQLSLSEQTIKKQVQNALKILKSKLGPLFSLLFIF